MNSIPPSGDSGPVNVEQAVRARYSAASQAAEPALCCPVQYDARLLAAIPAEILERDYGCGDPSRYVAEGETVLDLGSGGGKICYIASQIVGPAGRVIGVDMNNEMLALARRHAAEIGERIGWRNVAFHKGRIQDLALDLEAFEAFLAGRPANSSDTWLEAHAEAERMRLEQPMIADDSIDCILSNCVLNLVDPEARRELFAEMARVLRPGGRAVISDIVSDEPVPDELRSDAELWSGCISGAFVEHEFLEAFEEAGFVGAEVLALEPKPWRTVAGIEFRSITVRAYKPSAEAPLDEGHALIYRGPFHTVMDDEGTVLRRGERTAVSGRTYRQYLAGSAAGQVIPVPPVEDIDPAAAPPFDAERAGRRDPAETKGPRRAPATLLPISNCNEPGCC